jgi:hypothetical protein
MHYFTKIINILYFLNVLDDMAITEELRTNHPHIGIGFAATKEIFNYICKQYELIRLQGCKKVNLNLKDT